MLPSIAGPHVQGRRQVAASALVVPALLGLACEKKAAQPPPPAGYFEKERRAGDNGFGLQNYSEVSTALAAALDPDTLSARKIVRNGALDLLVNDVGQSATKIGSIVTGAGGYVEKATQTTSGGHSANMTVRVPAASLDKVIADIKHPAANVDRESVEGRDVTREYVDLGSAQRQAGESPGAVHPRERTQLLLKSVVE